MAATPTNINPVRVDNSDISGIIGWSSVDQLQIVYTAGSNITIDPATRTISATGGGTPGGLNTQVQYNNAGAFGGISGATTNGTTLTLVAPVLGTPTSGTLTNCTGLPIASGVSGLATGIAAFLATPSSANLAAAVTNETGSGSLVFGTSPTLSNPVVGTQAQGDNSTKAASTAFVIKSAASVLFMYQNFS